MSSRRIQFTSRGNDAAKLYCPDCKRWRTAFVADAKPGKFECELGHPMEDDPMASAGAPEGTTESKQPASSSAAAQQHLICPDESCVGRNQRPTTASGAKCTVCGKELVAESEDKDKA